MRGAENQADGETWKQAGFTLVEVLLVMLVLSVIAAIVVYSVTGLTFGAATAACRSDYRTVEHAELSYEAQVGTYAPTVSDLKQPVTLNDGTTVGPWLSDSVGNSQSYLIAIDDGAIAGGTAGNVTVSSLDPLHAPRDGDENCNYA